jgi:hypothetical protein
MEEGSMPEENGSLAIDFEGVSEPWQVYELSDGTRLRMRVIPSSIRREEGRFDQTGNPVYLVDYQVIIGVISSPDSLRKPAESPHEHPHEKL